MNGVKISEVLRVVEEQGAAGLDRLGGPFLVAIPTQAPVAISTSTSSTTSRFDEEILLDLSRSAISSDIRVYPLDCGTVVGRADGCQVPFATDRSLSKRHASFTSEGSSWYVTDLGSQNGTFVESARLEAHVSTQVDSLSVIQVGGRRFVFMDADALHTLLTPVQSPEPIPVARLKTELDALGTRRFVLRHSSPYLLVQVTDRNLSELAPFAPQLAYPLLGKVVFKVGRTGRADITLRNTWVSKWHGLLVRKDGRFHFQDTGASYGTRVNGRLLAERERVPLTSWDALIFGKQAWALFLKPRGLVEHLSELDEDW